VESFQKMMRAEVDRYNGGDPEDKGDKSDGSDEGRNSVDRRQNRPTGILRSSVDFSLASYNNARLNRTEIYKWAAFLLYPTIARYRPA
jgi:hypothetical protein